MTTYITKEGVSWRNWTIEGGYIICSFCDKKCYTSFSPPNLEERIPVCKECLIALRNSVEEIIHLECVDLERESDNG